MNLNKVLSIGLLFVFALSACQSTPSAPTQAPPAAPTAYPGPAQGYPVPDQGYPSPAQGYPAPLQNPPSAYPGPQAGGEIPWDQVQAKISSGEVTKVMQTHDLKIVLTLNDGTTLTTVEPQIDAIMQMIKQCGDPCKNILVSTE